MGQAANEIASIGKLLTDRWLHRRQLAGRCSSTISFWHLRAWGFNPRACAPYRARTKGKTESGVGYVKNNAIAGHSFESWEAFEAHLAKWEREVANVRIHGTTGEAPIARFKREEA